jgi:serine/threonine-protein kinase
MSNIPERIGRYRIIRPLSKGGMALVFEARRESLAGVSPRVAVKVILPDYANSTTFRDLFINEARLGAAMQHQNLVQIQDFDADGDRYFLVMEYVDGLTLSRMIGLAARHGLRVPMGVLCEVGRQACDGLHYAHQAIDPDGRALGLVHRDIKPSNLIVTPQGGVKILDFGISKGTLRAERAGSVKGTWGYMAPEQAHGDRVGPTADIFALGIVLYEMAARRSMFKGRSEDEIRQMLSSDHAAKMIGALDPSYAPVAGVLERALQRDRLKRFATAADFGRALSELLPDPISARDQTIRFYEQITALNEQEKAARGEAAPMPRATASRSVASMTLNRPSTASETSPALIAFSIAAGALATISAFVLGYTLLSTSDGQVRTRPVPQADVVAPVAPTPTVAPAEATPVPAPAEAAAPEPTVAPTPEPPAATPEPTLAAVAPAPAERPLPVRSVTPEDAEPAERVVRPRIAPSEATPPPEPVDQATLRLSSVQQSEIYLDGKLVRGTPGAALKVSPGRHVVSFVAPDGRRVSRVVDLAVGDEEKLVWDFEAWDYR